jgi:capsular exopolysaccharide synthesis family protein
MKGTHEHEEEHWTMSGLQRATERAEREGLLTWTRDGTERSERVQVKSRSGAEIAEAPVPSATAVTIAEPATQIAERPLNASLVAATQPASFAADQYRFLRTRVEGLEGGDRLQTLLVTSPGSGDGKTTTSANLALTMARERQQKVVLVEGDVRRPTLAALFGVPAKIGLVDVLMGTCSLEEALVEVPGQLFLLPAGAPGMSSTELFGSSMMQRVLSALRGRFSRIILDSAPAATSETHALARLADRVLVVVRAGVTPRPNVARALAVIGPQRVLGIVLNDVDAAPEAYQYASPPPRASHG